MSLYDIALLVALIAVSVLVLWAFWCWIEEMFERARELSDEEWYQRMMLRANINGLICELAASNSPTSASDLMLHEALRHSIIEYRALDG